MPSVEGRATDMDNYWSQMVGAAIALVGAGLGALLQHHLAQKQFRAQQQWSAREKHYMELLGHLSRARVNLTALSEYFMEPDSEHNDYSKDSRFKQLRQNVHVSLAALKELVGPARVFLSKDATDALDDLQKEEWSAGMDAFNESEYIESLAKLVEYADSKVLAAAKAHLNS